MIREALIVFLLSAFVITVPVPDGAEDSNKMSDVSRYFLVKSHEEVVKGETAKQSNDSTDSMNEEKEKKLTFSESIDLLNDEAKEFMERAMNDTEAVFVEFIEKVVNTTKIQIDNYEALSDDAKNSLAEQFPIMTAVYKHDIVQFLITELQQL